MLATRDIVPFTNILAKKSHDQNKVRRMVGAGLRRLSMPPNILTLPTNQPRDKMLNVKYVKMRHANKMYDPAQP